MMAVWQKRQGGESGEGVSREEKVAVVEAYLRGLAGKDISKIPFAENITFEGPRVGKLIGRNAQNSAAIPSGLPARE